MAKNCIKKGEEVFDCYGQHHLSNSKTDRQKIITSAFMFQCKCKVRLKIMILYVPMLKSMLKACVDNWPMWNEVEARLTPAETSKLGTNLSKYQVYLR